MIANGWRATRAETRYGCFLPDLTELARDPPAANRSLTNIVPYPGFVQPFRPKILDAKSFRLTYPPAPHYLHTYS